jgi:hypothetical protein
MREGAVLGAQTFFGGRAAAVLSVVATLLLALALASAQVALATPIPEGPEANSVPSFIGSPANPNPVSMMEPEQHPFMAANGRSNIHNDAYQTDTYAWSGPLGSNTDRLSMFMGGECATATFDLVGRIVTICVGFEGPKLAMFDPATLDLLASFPLPPRQVNTGSSNPFTDFSGGGYFYLDQNDRAVIPTTTRHIWVIAETTGPTGPAFSLVSDYDLTAAVPVGDGVISAMPDWFGRIWFVSGTGVVGTVDPASGDVQSIALGEKIGNSFAVDETGAVFIVSDAAMYRFEAEPDGVPYVVWREAYENIGVRKPGQTQAGSGTTPTLMGRDLVAITDNADPMNIVVYYRTRRHVPRRQRCKQRVFEAGASATDQSLIATNRSMIAENNYGYTGPTSVMDGVTTAPGIERVDLAGPRRCRTVWRNNESAPSVVPELSRGNGLVYTYTKPANAEGTDAWYLTAIDFRTGSTVYKRLAGTGLGFNNNFAPVSLGPDGTAYVGALGGLVRLRDQ